MLTEILSRIGDGNPGKKYIHNCNLTEKILRKKKLISRKNLEKNIHIYPVPEYVSGIAI